MMKIDQIVKQTGIVSLFLILTGCGTKYQITSEPVGAEVYLNGQPKGTTPTKLAFVGQSRTVTLKKEGYEDVSKILDYTGGLEHLEHFILPVKNVAPLSFIRTMEPTWASIEIRDDVEFEDAWNTIVDLLVRNFDMAILSKENGYMRTGWLFSWTGVLRDDYKVRVTIKFSPDKTKVDVKSEANYREKIGWILGSDTSLLKTLKTDLMGTVGRVTR